MRINARAVRILMASREIRTQAELCEMTGLTDNGISYILTELRTPSLVSIHLFCVALQCTPNDILMLDDGRPVEDLLLGNQKMPASKVKSKSRRRMAEEGERVFSS